jgi:hypothetical protein
MAAPKKISVMISSRCTDEIEFNGKRVGLSDVRKALKGELEMEQLLDSQLFDIWINEDAPPAPGTDDSWDACMKQVREADVVLVLYNGVSGWAARNGEIGICHGELQTALAEAPGRVRLIELPIAKSSTQNKDRDIKFQKFVSIKGLFEGRKRTLETMQLCLRSRHYGMQCHISYDWECGKQVKAGVRQELH